MSQYIVITNSMLYIHLGLTQYGVSVFYFSVQKIHHPNFEIENLLHHIGLARLVHRGPSRDAILYFGNGIQIVLVIPMYK